MSTPLPATFGWKTNGNSVAPVTRSISHQGQDCRCNENQCDFWTPHCFAVFSSASRVLIQSRAVGRPESTVSLANARSKSCSTSRPAVERGGVPGGRLIRTDVALAPYGKRISLIAVEIGISPLPENRPAKGWRPRNRSWNTRTARPKLSWLAFRTMPARDFPCSSGGVNVSTPLSQRKLRPPVVIWNESQLTRRTVASWETSTLPWLTSPITDRPRGSQRTPLPCSPQHGRGNASPPFETPSVGSSDCRACGCPWRRRPSG